MQGPDRTDLLAVAAKCPIAKTPGLTRNLKLHPTRRRRDPEPQRCLRRGEEAPSGEGAADRLRRGRDESVQAQGD